MFQVSKLEEMLNCNMPIHVVEKKIPYMDKPGNLIKPDNVNGYKFETLVLDMIMIRFMETCLPFEVDRCLEFAPIKNRTGVDSVETARKLLLDNGVSL